MLLKRMIAAILVLVLLVSCVSTALADSLTVLADMVPTLNKDLFVFNAEEGTPLKANYTMGDYLTQANADGSYKVTRAVSLQSGIGFDYSFDVPEEGTYDILVKILQQGTYNYYIDMLLDDKGVTGNASQPNRYGINSRYSQDFHWMLLDTETLTKGTHKVTIKCNKNMIYDKIMIVNKEYGVKGSSSIPNTLFTDSFEETYFPDDRYNVALNDYKGKQLDISVEKGSTSIPENTTSFNSATNLAVEFKLPLPREQAHYSSAWSDLTLDDGVNKTAVNAVYTIKNYTLTVNGETDVTVKQKGVILSPVNGVYNVEALSEVTLINNSDEELEWFDQDGNRLGSEKSYTFIPTGDTKIYLDPQFVKAGLSDIKINGVSLENFLYTNILYNVNLEKGIDYPSITATPMDENATVTITQAANNNGTALIDVVNGEWHITYKVVFNKLDYTISQAELMDKKNGAEAIIILIHDDGNIATAEFMADEFKAKGLKGSIALVNDWVSSSAVPGWQKLFDTGVLNVASHSKTHVFMGLTDEAHTITWQNSANNPTQIEERNIPAGTITAEIKTSQELLREKFPGQRVLAFCHVGAGYTYVDGKLVTVSEEGYKMMEKYYVGGRGNFGTDKNYTWPRSKDQWYKIGYTSDTYDKFDAEGNITTHAEKYVDDAINNKGFYLYFWHGIGDTLVTNSDVNGEGKTKKEDAAETFSYISDKVKKNIVWNPFFEEALQYGREYQDILENGVAEIRTYNDDKKAVYLSDTLRDDMFDYPLTVKVEVDNLWHVVKQLHNGEETVLIPFEEDGKKYVYAQVIPDKGEAVLTNNANKKFEAWNPPAPVNPPLNTHPRVLFRQEDIPEIKENMTKGENVYAYNALMENVNTELTVPEEAITYSESTIDVIEGKAFYYAIFKDDPEYAEAALKAGKEALQGIDVMRKMTHIVDSVGITSRNSGRIMNGIAHVYDWCYDLLSEEQKSIIPNLFREYGQHMENWVKPSDDDAYNGTISAVGPIASHLSESLLLRDMLSFAVAVYDERPDIWNLAGGIYYDKYVPARAFWSQSHYTHQGGDYGNYRQQFDDYAIMLMLGMGAEAPYNIDNVAKTGYKYIYMRRPDGVPFQDGDDSTKISPFAYYTNYSDSLILKYAMSKETGAYDPYLKDEILRSCFNYSDNKISFNKNFNIMYMLIFNDPDDKPKTRYDLPHSKYFDTPSGIMMTRTGWDDGDNSSVAAAFMKIGEYSFNEHQHLDAGSFQLYYKGILATDSGNYELYGKEEHAFYTRKTVAHNSMLVFKPDEYVKLDGTPSIDHKWSPSLNDWMLRMGDTNDGGQVAKNMYAIATDIEMLKKKHKHSEVIAKEIDPKNTQKPEYTYLKGDLTEAYWNGVDENTRKVSDYNRSFMFLDLDDKEVPAALIVFDEMTAVDKTYKKTWLLHGTQEPEINGNKSVFENTAESNSGNYGGRLEVTTLLPKQDNIATDVVGGPEEGYGVVRRWAYNEEKADWEMTFEHNYENTYTDPKRETNGYRIEISPKTPNEKDCFLNVMLMTDAGQPTEINPELIETANFYGVTLFDRAVFFATETEQNTMFITENLEDKTFKYTVCDMKPGKYQVTDSKGTQTVYVSDEGHVLSFTATGNVSAEWIDTSYIAPVDTEYEVYNGVNIKVDNNYVSAGKTFKIDGVDGVYGDVEEFTNSLGLTCVGSGTKYKVFRGIDELATIFTKEGTVVTTRGYIKPEGGIITEGDKVYIKLNVLFDLFAGSGNYNEETNTFFVKSADLYPKGQVFAQGYTKSDKTYINVHLANALMVDMYCGAYKDGKLVASKKLAEGDVPGAFRAVFDAETVKDAEFKLFLWTDEYAPIVSSITLKEIAIDNIKVYNKTLTAEYPPAVISAFMFGAGSMVTSNDSFALKKTDETKPNAAFGFQFAYYEGPKMGTDYIGHYSATVKDIAASCASETIQLRFGGRVTKNSSSFTGTTYKQYNIPRNIGTEFELDCIVDYKNSMAYVYVDGKLATEISMESWTDYEFLITAFQLYLANGLGYKDGAMNVYFPTYICYPYSDDISFEDLVNNNTIILN